MIPENVYTSTGVKLIHHPNVVSHMKKGFGTPISFQIAPTSQCNLKCDFCSNVNRAKHESLKFVKVTKLIEVMKELGLKTVEWTGGGDPTLWEPINEAIAFVDSIDIEQGFITNGLLLKENLRAKIWNRLKWLRISMNCLDYVQSVDLPFVKGTLGFSYVWNDRTDDDVLRRLHEHVKKYRPAYVRVVPNCQVSFEQQEVNNERLTKIVKEAGKPYFYQAKHFERPEKCYWCYIKPFLLHDEWIYPCSSVVLNSTSERQFHSKYRWVHMDQLIKMYKKKIEPFGTKNCDHCVFMKQNTLCNEIINPTGMENFV